MKSLLFLSLSLAALVSFQSYSAEGRGNAGAGASGGAGVHAGTGGVSASAGVSAGAGARYNSSATHWAEGTVSARGADGRLSIRGSNAPYANDYMSYHHDYYSSPDRRGELGTRYHDRLNYNWNDTNLTDYSFTVPNYSDSVIYDEPNYGQDYTSWNYSSEPTTYHYNDINVGDRVVIGYDENGNKVQSMYRVHGKSGNDRSVNTSNVNGRTGEANVPNGQAGSTNRAPSDRSQNSTGNHTTGTNDVHTPSSGTAGSTNRAPSDRSPSSTENK